MWGSILGGGSQTRHICMFLQARSLGRKEGLFHLRSCSVCLPASFLRHRRFLSRNAGITLYILVSLALPSAEQRSLQRSGRGKERDLCRPLVAASS